MRAEVEALRCMLILPCWRLPFSVCVCVGGGGGGVGAGAGRVAAGQFHVFFNGYLPVVAV